VTEDSKSHQKIRTRGSGWSGGVRRSGGWSPTAWRRIAVLAAGIAAAACSPARGEGVDLGEYELKAAFLFNFAKFIQWPAETFPDAETPLVIGVLGDDPFGAVLDSLVNRQSANGRHLVVRRGKSLAEIGTSQILFVSRSEASRLESILASVGSASTVTVGEVDRFTEAGGVIHLVRSGAHIRFEVNLFQAEQNHLKLSSKLLTLARIVRPIR
jgi:hypothetical protein